MVEDMIVVAGFKSQATKKTTGSYPVTTATLPSSVKLLSVGDSLFSRVLSKDTAFREASFISAECSGALPTWSVARWASFVVLCDFSV